MSIDKLAAPVATPLTIMQQWVPLEALYRSEWCVGRSARMSIRLEVSVDVELPPH